MCNFRFYAWVKYLLIISTGFMVGMFIIEMTSSIFPGIEVMATSVVIAINSHRNKVFQNQIVQLKSDIKKIKQFLLEDKDITM